MSGTHHSGYLVCDPATSKIVKKSRTIPTMTPIDLDVFVVGEKFYHIAHPGDSLDPAWLSDAQRAVWERSVVKSFMVTL